MILWLMLGIGCLALLLGAGQGFSRARVETLRSLVAWVAALAGLSLATLLLLTGRGAAAIAALVMFGPLVWSWWQPAKRKRTAASPQAQMSQSEAFSVLGLQPGASEAEIRAAYLRVMRAAHPDGGGTDWLATRVNQARDVLLRR